MSSSLNIVIADDEEHIIRPLQIFLERAGHSVRSARNAEEALALIMSSPVDLLFTDVDMGGGMDGIQLAIVLRDRGYPFPIVVSSAGMDSRQAAQHLAGLEKTRFLPKPFVPKTAISVIEEMASPETSDAPAVPLQQL